MTISCRLETLDDEPFVRRLLTDSITAELGAEAWPESLRAQLVGRQYRARRSSVHAAADEAASQIIVEDGEDVGWLLAAELDDEIRIIEILVTPRRRGRGVGSAAIRLVLERAARAGKTVRLVVNGTNVRAIRLYGQLGFRTMDDHQVQHLMRWSPPAGA